MNSVPYNLEIKFTCELCGHEEHGQVRDLCIGEMLPLRLPPTGWSVASLPLDTPTPYYRNRDFNCNFPRGRCPVVICPRHSVVVQPEKMVVDSAGQGRLS